ncbi:uncharacterized protein [Heterodontus francisci]|uniref:uncharacterized protein isoform X3 n=1 Tax=Heterodontus francisci TaxID=7792 RepID=UPI00355BAB37
MICNLIFLTVDTVRDLPPPTIAISAPNEVFEEGTAARIECRSPGHHEGSTFYLMKDGQSTSIAQKTVPDREDTATFQLVNLTMQDQGQYRCFYRKKESGRWKNSMLSDPVQIHLPGNSWNAESPDPPRIQGNIWVLTGIVAGGAVFIMIITAIVCCICRKKSESRRRRNDGADLWTTSDNNINNLRKFIMMEAANKRNSFRFSQDLEHPREEEEGSAYFANHSTEFLNDTELTPGGLNRKPYFITFREHQCGGIDNIVKCRRPSSIFRLRNGLQ